MSVSYTLSEDQLYDLELLLVGAFSPLKTFCSKADYYSILENHCTLNNDLFPIPITLKISKKQCSNLNLSSSSTLELKDTQGVKLATLKVNEMFPSDPKFEAEMIYNCLDDNHEQIKTLLSSDDNCFSGELIKHQLPKHYDFLHLRRTPDQVKQYFKDNSWTKVIGFQTRNPMHRSHFELTRFAQRQIGDDCKLLLHPVVGPTQSGDIPYRVRIKCYEKLLNHYPEGSTLLSLLPLRMRMAGPREALLHAIIRRNYGCTHFIIGRDHAGPSVKRKDGKSYFGPYDAQHLLEKFKDQVGIEVITSEFIVYEPTTNDYYQMSKVPEGLKPLHISGTQLRECLLSGKDIPEWFSFPEVIKVLRKGTKPLYQKGFCVYFTGLSGSGKSTLANLLKTRLEELQLDRDVTVLDGDQVRLHLSKGLTFSQEDRSTNVRRIGYVASEIVKHNGICLAANIAPYMEDREWNRKLISQYGGYFEAHVETDISECEKRDLKGLYKLAREGKIKQFTGISDPYEVPSNPEFLLDSGDNSDLLGLVDKMIVGLKESGYLYLEDEL